MLIIFQLRESYKNLHRLNTSAGIFCTYISVDVCRFKLSPLFITSKNCKIIKAIPSILLSTLCVLLYNFTIIILGQIVLNNPNKLLKENVKNVLHKF